MHKMLACIALLALPALAGCLDDSTPADPVDAGTEGLTSVHERAAMDFDVDSPYSYALVEGVFDILPSQSIFVDVPLSPAELGAAADPTSPPRIHMGLFLPDVPEGTKVPVIADIGPYYDDGDVGATERGSGRLGEFLIENFVPHGYAVAQVSVVGTGQSNHCMDMMGDAEQAGVHAAVEFLGQAEWSNGNVGLIGRSYDGSTPWQAAAMGSEHLKTIVPISGLTGIPELMFFNGAPETRNLLFHNVVYGTFAVDQDIEDLHNVCPDYLASTVYQTEETFGQGFIGMNPYYAERTFFDRALANYDGSVYLIHGLQDWNVDPHAAMPYFPQMQERWEAKGLFGQWDHAYPDRVSDHSDQGPGRGQEAFPDTVRKDWAQDLLEWFDHYLMETGPQPPLHVEVQDHLGNWRVEETWPPQDADELVLELAGNGPESLTLMAVEGDTGTYRWTVENDTILTGIPSFQFHMVPSAPQGLVYAELRDATDNVRLGHGVIDIRYPNGGSEYDPASALVETTITMPMEAMEAYVPAGHELELIVAESGEGYILGMNTLPNTFHADGATLTFTARDPVDAAFFTPPVVELEVEEA